MSLLESMRSGTDSTFMQLVFAAVVISFVGWGLGVNGDTSQAVAKVNGEVITGIEFSEAYRSRESQEERRSREGLTQDDRSKLRSTVLDELVRSRALLQEASELGLEVSDTEVANVLLTFDAFKDAEGNFDFRLFENALRRRGSTRANYEETIREDLLLRKLQELMIMGASVSEPMVKSKYVEENTKIDVEYLRVRPSNFFLAYQPTEEEIAAWGADHDAEIKARYDRDFSGKYDQPEKVILSVIRLAVREDGLRAADLATRLEMVRQQIVDGSDFGELAARWSEDASAASGGQLAERPSSKLDPDALAAIADLEAGDLSTVVTGDREVRLFRLDQRIDAKVIPVTEVTSVISLDLMREEQGPILAAEFAEKEVLPAWQEAGAAPEELVAGKKALLEGLGEDGSKAFIDLQVKNTELQAATQASPFGPPAEMLKAARGADEGAVLPEVYEAGGTLFVGQLVAREDADMDAYEEEADEVRERALIERRREFFEAWVEDVVARAKVTRYGL